MTTNDGNREDSVARRKNLVDNMFDRLDDASKDVRKAARRTFKSKKKKKSGSRKWAKRNNRALEDLTEQMTILTKHVSAMAGQPKDSDRTS
ncbi:hypothetical protein ACFFQW_38465 [Umezawaea endophytica]|uniref:Uncharacterized protein n=1 Tax=Umezawaea endophytica TaxID=1654476 RepID=A0A9X2VVW8_9PSEU|nr:hypothetical protein [Umezawaea endophytica]MCS7483828.1 hypothetical protein [Umezawaea endophytica]